jgi:very-short-patch-repair endonuclease
VHSFDAHRALKTDDLRFQLLQHARDPGSTPLHLDTHDVPRAESPLEREVAKCLAAARFRVKQQMSVGHFRIDMVVENGERRLAVECDGDRYRSPESINEDTARQAVLERLGWQFVRIRGSAFYRDPDAALRRVFDRLSELGIEPIEEGEEAPEVAAPAQSTLIEELEALRSSPTTSGAAGTSSSSVEAAPEALPKPASKIRKKTTR